MVRVRIVSMSLGKGVYKMVSLWGKDDRFAQSNMPVFVFSAFFFANCQTLLPYHPACLLLGWFIFLFFVFLFVFFFFFIWPVLSMVYGLPFKYSFCFLFLSLS